MRERCEFQNMGQGQEKNEISLILSSYVQCHKGKKLEAR
jgi:hypothetical protein